MSWRAVPTSAAVAALFLLFPAVGWSAVPRSGDTFSPRSGSELVEAANAISAEGASSTSFKGVIELAAVEYVVDAPVVLTSLAEATVKGPSPENRATITNSGMPFTLLRLSSRVTSPTSGVSNVDFNVRNTGGVMPSPVVAVDLQRGAQLRDSLITVPLSAPKATGLRLSPALGNATPVAPATARRVAVESSAMEAPGVRITNGGQFLDRGSIRGGIPALDIAGDASGPDLGNATVDASTVRSYADNSVNTPTTVPVVRVRGGGNHLRTVLWSTVVDGMATSASQLIDVVGPSVASGSTEVDLGQLTLRGPSAGFGVNVRPGAGTSPLNVRIRGLLSLGSQVPIECSGSASSTTFVTVTGIYRGAQNNSQNTGCDLFETDRRVIAPTFRDESAGDFRPAWDSSLIDGVSDVNVPLPAGERDLVGGSRFVAVTNTSSPGDIGAWEYQVTPPENVTASYLTFGNRGKTLLTASATDADPQEELLLKYRWTLPNGGNSDGSTFPYRFTTAEPQEVKLAVTDVSGVTVRRTLIVTPVVRLDEPATDLNPGDPVPDPGDPVPDPGDGGDGGETGGASDDGGGLGFKPVIIPVTPTIPKAVTVVTKPGIDPSLKQEFPPILKKVTAKKRRVKTSRLSQPKYASARSGEAEFVIETWRKSEMALEVSSVLEGEGMTVGLPLATVPLKQFKGRKTLRVGAKVGKRKLKPGLYQMTIAATPRPGAVPERISYFVRVVRAR